MFFLLAPKKYSALFARVLTAKNLPRITAVCLICWEMNGGPKKNRTHKHYRASLHILEKARRNDPTFCSVIPPEIKTPVVKKASLMQLKLGKSDLNSPELERTIKRAFRFQVKKHHPDLGGDADTFRKIHQAYLELISWAENPSYLKRRGFPDRWFYDGYKNRWLQPAPHLKK